MKLDKKSKYLDLLISGIPEKYKNHDELRDIVKKLGSKWDKTNFANDITKVVRIVNNQLYVRFRTRIIRDKFYENGSHFTQEKKLTAKKLLGGNDNIDVSIDEIMDDHLRRLYNIVEETCEDYEYLFIFHGKIYVWEDEYSTPSVIRTWGDSYYVSDRWPVDGESDDESF